MSLTSLLYRAARASATGRAVKRSAETGSVAPIVRRQVRRAAYRHTARITRSILKGLGS